MSRIIGIQHRIKFTREGEAKPTIIYYDGKSVSLETENDELNWLKGQYPLAMRKANANDNLELFPSHLVAWKELPEDASKISANLIVGKNYADKVPTVLDGLKTDDVVITILGGSGDRFVAGLAKQGEKINAQIYRVPAGKLFTYRQSLENEITEAEALVKMYQELPEKFYFFRPSDREIIRISSALKSRTEALKAKVGCETRIFSNLIGSIFLNEDGMFPEGEIDSLFKEAKANDKILEVLNQILKQQDSVLEKAVHTSRVWQIFADLAGVGPRIAAGIIAPIGDIRRFETEHQLKKFCGVHVIGSHSEGKFPRKSRGSQNDWNPKVRQALYLLADQFNRRPDSVWGQKFLEVKTNLRLKHPEPIKVISPSSGKEITKYSNGHIHKMAQWKTLNKFVVWLFKAWKRLEAEQHLLATSAADSTAA